MTSHGARTGRRTLASTSCLLLLTGLSCKYNVTLPWVPEDAKAPVSVPDTSFDQSPPSPPDVSLSGLDARGCSGGNLKTFDLQRGPAQIFVAIDRSTSMQKEFDSTTKTLAAVSALNTSGGYHPAISFVPIAFPGTNCGGGSTCCASPVYNTGRTGSPDASWGCGPFDAGCLPSSDDSPSHQALKQANALIKEWWIWNTLVLITDRNPSCARESSDSDACDAAIREADQLGDKNVRTYVIVPLAEGSVPNCLKEIAKKNPRDSSDAQQPRLVKNSQDMRSQLDRIASEIEEKLCRFYPPGGIESGWIDQVRIAGQTIQRDETGQTGWKVVDSAIVLSTPECIKTNKIATPDVKGVTCGSGYGQGPSYGN